MANTKSYEAMESAVYAQARNEYERLSFGIILRAVKDYHMAIKNNDFRLKRDCIQFFKSKWFRLLSNIPGDNFLDLLQDETEKEAPINTIDIPRLRSRKQACL